MRIAFTGLGVLCAITAAASSHAEPILNLSGRLELLGGASAQGTRVEVGIDVDRDGELNSFEIAQGTVGSNGQYTIGYEPDPASVDFEFVQFVIQLLGDYQARGFEALLDDGPLPVMLRFDREGYSTVIKRFSTLSDAPSFDIIMQPLAQIQCAEDACMSTDGQVQISGFPGGTGIARAFARAHDPETNGALFPGVFADKDNNLLISSGFTEIDLRDENGEKIHRLSSPVSVRFEASRDSWASLRDLEPDSGEIEVPMYSFDENIGEWVSEADGVLQDTEGTAIAEEEFASIQAGDYAGAVFVAFETDHFSTFNCDAPVTRRACVKGRVVFEGEAVAGARVSAEGVSYTGSAGSVITGADGFFATDLMKSEATDEDVDGNGSRGETFTARVSVGATLGIYIGATFDTPTLQGSIGTSTSSCPPADCECLDLGDIEADFEPARACEVTVRVTFSGTNIVGAEGPLAEGDAIANAEITGSFAGQTVPQIDPTLCQDLPCGSADADADGMATFIIPVVGAEPSIQVRASYSVEVDGESHYYDGSITVAGCAEGDAGVAAEIELQANHSSLGGLADFIAALGAGPAVPGDDDGLPSVDDVFEPPKAPKCGCRTVGSADNGSGWAVFAMALLGSAWLRRSNRRAT